MKRVNINLITIYFISLMPLEADSLAIQNSITRATPMMVGPTGSACYSPYWVDVDSSAVIDVGLYKAYGGLGYTITCAEEASPLPFQKPGEGTSDFFLSLNKDVGLFSTTAHPNQGCTIVFKIVAKETSGSISLSLKGFGAGISFGGGELVYNDSKSFGFGACPIGPPNSPIFVDLDRNGVNFNTSTTSVEFDIDADGFKENTAWPGEDSGDALLTIDLNENGQIDNGSELFGNSTKLILQNQVSANHGYEALAQYDRPELGGDSDGVISKQDNVWNSLLIWSDVNADGFSDADELKPVSEHKFTKFSFTPRINKNKTDSAGNKYAYWAWAYKDNMKFKTVDVFLVEY